MYILTMICLVYIIFLCIFVAVCKLKELVGSDNEVLLGNTCLCLSHCIEERSVNELLDKESMKKLLVVVREAKSSVVKQNAAILVGKLVKANPRYVLVINMIVCQTAFINSSLFARRERKYLLMHIS